MKKVFALMIVAAALTFTACGGKKAENTEAAADSAAMAAPAVLLLCSFVLLFNFVFNTIFC